MTRYSQQDPRWKDAQLGDGEYTIGQAGCLVTDLAMACQMRPDTMNEKFLAAGGFLGSLVIPELIAVAAPGMNCVKSLHCEDVAAPMDLIDKSLKEGKKVIVRVDSSPAAGIQDHWVLLTEKFAGDYRMLDPWPLEDPPVGSKGSFLLQRYGQGKSAAEAIISVLVLSGEVKVKEPNPQPLPAPNSTYPQPLPEGRGVGQVRVISDYVFERLNPGKQEMILGRVMNGETRPIAPNVKTVEKDGITWQPVWKLVWVGTGEGGETFLQYE